MSDPLNLFWDSCVFCAHLFEETSRDLKSIEQFLLETKGLTPKWKIYASSLIYTEIMESKIVRKGLGRISDLLDDLAGSIILIDPTPPILQLAGQLKDISYKKGQSEKRRLTTGDAIMLASCLHVQDVLKIPIEHFHTYDDGRQKREIPLLSYHEWCEGLTGKRKALADRVCALNRRPPTHPDPPLLEVREPSKPKVNPDE